MKRAVIFLHGNKPNLEVVRKHIKKSDIIICADGGAMWAVSFGLTPDVILGDFDSITPSLHKKLQKENIEWHTFPKEKDQTDSELAIEYAIKKGYKEIFVFGVFGSRLDHMMGNLSMFADIVKDQQVRVTALVENQKIYFVSEKITLAGKIGDYISLIPLKNDCIGVTTKGLKWRLYNDTLYFGKTIGISNEFVEKKVEIAVDKGILMVVHTIK